MNTENKSILVECNNLGIGVITLNRPEKHNAFNEHIIEQLTEALLKLDRDSQVKIILLNANGKNFSAGADLEWMKRMLDYTEQENFTDAMQLVKLLKTLYHVTKPTIALAKGITLGGGVGLLCCCDIVIAEENARFSFSEAKLGLVPATISPYVIRAIGQRAARYYFLTAKTFTADEAKAIGLVQEVIPHEDMLSAGMTFAATLLKNGPQALTIIKKLVSDFDVPDDALLKESATLIAKVRTSEEAQEGISAFFEKRDPTWSVNLQEME